MKAIIVAVGVMLDLMSEQVPDASTLRRFRRFLEENELCEAMLDELTHLLERAGVMMHSNPTARRPSGRRLRTLAMPRGHRCQHQGNREANRRRPGLDLLRLGV